MDHPDVSVVIPCYSRGWELAASIESVLSQSYQNFEIILVDNNAKEGTREVIERYSRQYPEKIRVVHEADQGVCSARNAGIMAARGKFVATQDEDDVMKPRRLEVQRDLLLSQPELSLVTSGYDLLSPDGKTVLEESIFYPTVKTENSFMLSST